MYRAPGYACPCGAPFAPPLLRGAPAVPVTHRTWDDDWVAVRCDACDRVGHWPQPELCCPCGTVLRLPVRPEPPAGPARPASGDGPAGLAPESDSAPPLNANTPSIPSTQDNPSDPDVPSDPSTPSSPDAPDPTGAVDDRARAVGPARVPPQAGPASPPRSPFRPHPVRTTRDVVANAARYLRWLGHHDAGPSTVPSPARIELRATGLIARVDTDARPATPRDIECLWLHALVSSATCVFFSVVGYAPDAGACADGLGVPLFSMDHTGTPRPANGPADELLATGS